MARQARSAQIRPYKVCGYGTTSAVEFVVDTDGLSFGIIYGECTSGYFIAIPNFGVSVPAAAPEDTFYNYERLRSCKNKFVSDNAKTLACAIKFYFEEGQAVNEDKAKICEKLGELLKLTRAGADIERIGYDEEHDCAAVYYKGVYGGIPSLFGMRLLNTAGDSGAQLIADVLREILK